MPYVKKGKHRAQEGCAPTVVGPGTRAERDLRRGGGEGGEGASGRAGGSDYGVAAPPPVRDRHLPHPPHHARPPPPVAVPPRSAPFAREPHPHHRRRLRVAHHPRRVAVAGSRRATRAPPLHVHRSVPPAPSRPVSAARPHRAVVKQTGPFTAYPGVHRVVEKPAPLREQRAGQPAVGQRLHPLTQQSLVFRHPHLPHRPVPPATPRSSAPPAIAPHVWHVAHAPHVVAHRPEVAASASSA